MVSKVEWMMTDCIAMETCHEETCCMVSSFNSVHMLLSIIPSHRIRNPFDGVLCMCVWGCVCVYTCVCAYTYQPSLTHCTLLEAYCVYLFPCIPFLVSAIPFPGPFLLTGSGRIALKLVSYRFSFSYTSLSLLLSLYILSCLVTPLLSNSR